MKRFLFIIFLTTFMVSVDAIEVNIVSGVKNTAISNTMQQTASKFLTEVQLASLDGRSTIHLKGLNAEPGFNDDFRMLWENMHFGCLQDLYNCNAIETKMGYQIRGIAIKIVPLDGTQLDDESLIKEGILNFTIDGKLKYFVMADDGHVGQEVVTRGEQLGDLTRRLQILDFVEQFRTAYNKKDLPFIENIFSDDALIITGKVKKYGKSEIIPSDMVEYIKQDKVTYINKLSNIFKTNAYINVRFDDIKIYRHPNPNYSQYYGVLVKQHWSSSSYSDIGHVFMLWDFTNENEPKIHVRTWQPIQIDVPFSIDDFDLTNE